MEGETRLKPVAHSLAKSEKQRTGRTVIPTATNKGKRGVSSVNEGLLERDDVILTREQKEEVEKKKRIFDKVEFYNKLQTGEQNLPKGSCLHVRVEENHGRGALPGVEYAPPLSLGGTTGNFDLDGYLLPNYEKRDNGVTEEPIPNLVAHDIIKQLTNTTANEQQTAVMSSRPVIVGDTSSKDKAKNWLEMLKKKRKK